MTDTDNLPEFSNLLLSITKNSDHANRRLKQAKKSLVKIHEFLNLPTPKWKVEPRFKTITYLDRETGEEFDEQEVTEKGEETKLLLQYDAEYQHVLIGPCMEIEHELSGVIPVAMNMRETYYKLETAKNQEPQLPQMPQSPTQVFVNPNPGWKAKFTSLGRKATSINDLQSPYQLALEPIQAVENIEQIYKKWIDYHTFGIIKHRRLTKKQMEPYLYIERKYFTDTVQPAIMKVIGEASRITLEKEQDRISSVVAQKLKQEEASKQSFS